MKITGDNGEVCDAREGKTCGCILTNRDVNDGIFVQEEGAQILVEICSGRRMTEASQYAF